MPVYARMLAPVYGGITGLRRRLFRAGLLRRQRLPVPVVVVGNITAGGTGKTPLTIALVQRLAAAGWKPGVASRGYGRKDEATPRWVEAGSDTLLAGDEPVLIAFRTGARVRVDRDRGRAARALVDAGCDIVICDDGLQHYRLARDLEIEVIDGARRYGNGRLLPAGPLREPAARAAECHFRVVNRGSAVGSDGDDGMGGFGEWQMRLCASGAVPLLGGRMLPLRHFQGQRVHAVAGIANPQRFFDTLKGAGIAPVPHVFPDHYRYRAEDLAFGSELPVLMTEKDAVKCAAFANDWHYSVPIAAELPAAFWVSLLDRLGRL